MLRVGASDAFHAREVHAPVTASNRGEPLEHILDKVRKLTLKTLLYERSRDALSRAADALHGSYAASGTILMR